MKPSVVQALCEHAPNPQDSVIIPVQEEKIITLDWTLLNIYMTKIDHMKYCLCPIRLLKLRGHGTRRQVFITKARLLPSLTLLLWALRYPVNASTAFHHQTQGPTLPSPTGHVRESDPHLCCPLYFSSSFNSVLTWRPEQKQEYTGTLGHTRTRTLTHVHRVSHYITLPFVFCFSIWDFPRT